jgi:hypothetical protein
MVVVGMVVVLAMVTVDVAPLPSRAAAIQTSDAVTADGSPCARFTPSAAWRSGRHGLRGAMDALWIPSTRSPILQRLRDELHRLLGEELQQLRQARSALANGAIPDLHRQLG